MQKILVVEDDLDIQELLKNFLQEAGYSIVLANDGVEALSIFSDVQFVILLVAVLASIVYSYYVTRPVLRISNVSKRMSELDFSWRCEENRTDELGILARSLNEMSQKLSVSMTDEKNSKWTPSNVSRNSMKVVWWKCGAGHSYRAKITDRTIEQKGCPQCEAEFQQALPQMLIMMYGAQNGITVKSNSDSELGMRLVAYLPELHCAVDIAGATVTEKREQSVKAHICQSNRLGYYLIKRTADASQMAAEIKTLFIRNHIYLHTDSEKDVQVLRERFLEWKYRNACKLNGKY